MQTERESSGMLPVPDPQSYLNKQVLQALCRYVSMPPKGKAKASIPLSDLKELNGIVADEYNTRNPQHVIIACNIQQKDAIHRKYVFYRGKTKDYMFFLYVIFSPDKLHVRLEDYIWNLEITYLSY